MCVLSKAADVSVCVCAYECVCECVSVCVCAHLSLSKAAERGVCVCVCVCVFMRVHMNVCVIQKQICCNCRKWKVHTTVSHLVRRFFAQRLITRKQGGREASCIAR